jgi:hypothetical protein
MPLMSEELAYVAGLIDGEGYIGIMALRMARVKRGIYHTPVVKLVVTDIATIDFLMGRFGGYRSVRNFPNNPYYQTAYGWEVKNCQPVIAFLKEVRPWLRIKAQQADVVLEFCEGRTQRFGRNGISDAEYDRRAESYRQIRQLNHRGPPPAETEREDTQ